MIGLLIADLDKEMTEAETTEKDSQADYLEMMKDTLKEGQTDLASTLKYIHDLHMECDWLLKYFDVRKEMRASEVDALGKARAVLNGADYSFLQTSRGLRGLRGASQ